jgi:ketosteroid isomerase-like protein
MTSSRRAFLSAAVVAASSGPAVSADPTPSETISELIDLSEASNAALMKGDIATYISLLTLADDFTLMSPFGGDPTRGPVAPERLEAMGRFFRNGDFAQEVVAAYATKDMAVLALIERSNVEVGGLAAQDWSLRVTLVYRRDAGRWRLVHRHADPIVAPMSLAQAAEIGRGERRP